jgi:poly-gamma-glutamate synthase PgsB/CapB
MHLGIDRETALKGMYQAIPDEGALMVFRVEAFKKQMVFYNAFAANDPDSTFLVWKKLRDEIGLEGKRIVLLNTRQDRLYRAQQLAEMVALKMEKEIDYLALIGQSTDVVETMALRYGIPRQKLIGIGWTTPDKVFETLLSLTDKLSAIVAIGNMGGMGAETVKYYENRSINT